MVPKYVDERYNEQDWATDNEQPQHQKVRDSSMFWTNKRVTILVAGMSRKKKQTKINYDSTYHSKIITCLLEVS